MGIFLITGASGFLGRALCVHLVHRGHEVHAVGRTPHLSITGVQYHPVESYEKSPFLSGAVGIHLAGENRIAQVETQPERLMEDSLALARALMKNKCDRWIYASSAIVYGDKTPSLRREDELPAPPNAYARIKLATEELFLIGGHAVVRPSNLYGPGMSMVSVLSEILAQLPGNEPVIVRNTSPVRDYLHVLDCAEGIAKIAEGRAVGIFNLGTGVGTSVKSLAELILKLAHQSERRVLGTQPAGQESTLCLDTSKMRLRFDWSPSVLLEKGLADMVAAAEKRIV